MNEHDDATPERSRANLSFRQAEGVDPLPTQLALRTISQELQAKLWLFLHNSLEGSRRQSGYSAYSLGPPWSGIMQSWFVLHEFWLVDQVPDIFEANLKIVRDIVTSRNYLNTFEFIQFVLQHPSCPGSLAEDLNVALESSRAAYRIVDNTIVHIASIEEASTISRAFVDLAAGEHNGARAHLRKAGELLTKGDFAESVRESIHSIEAIARKLEPSANGLGPALQKLQTKGMINPNLKRGFAALYEYTSDEEGIRHALIERGAPAVDEADALYMFGACASFVSYLLAKSRL